jgi:membrane protein required for colicin V production
MNNLTRKQDVKIMPSEFNWIDVIIAAIILFAVINGTRAGLIRSLFSIAGLIIGLMAAKAYHVQLGSLLPVGTWLPMVAVDAFSFLAIFIIAAALFHYLGSYISCSLLSCSLKNTDRFLGSFVGLLIGIVLVGALLIMLTAFPLFDAFPEQVEESYLAQPIVENVYLTYNALTDYLNLDLPQLTIYTEDMGAYFSAISIDADFHQIDFRTLDNATCFVCGDKVEYLGILDNGKGSVSPKFVCTACGRTSDGCQTYEGYHVMYEKCPVALGNQGYRFDCGIWTNNSYHRPVGPCPVCGTE